MAAKYLWTALFLCTLAARNSAANQHLDHNFSLIANKILKPHCAGCHGKSLKMANLDLSDPESAYLSLLGENSMGKPPVNSIAKENGLKLIYPGYPDKSFLIKKLVSPGLGEGLPMPSMQKKISQAGIECIKTWISQLNQKDKENLEKCGVFLAETTIRPQGKKLHFLDPKEHCQSCHPQHVAEWEISSHAYAAKDPVFLAMIKMGQRQTKGALGQFCVQCHMPTSFLLKQTPVSKNPATGFFEQSFAKVDKVGHQGVSCDVCHSITKIIEPVNGRIELRPNGIKLGTIRNPVATPAHGSQFSYLHASSKVCSGCHNVTNPKGALIEETFSEWSKSRFARGGGAEKKSCQDCHMATYYGKAAEGGPDRKVHRHTFEGVDVSLLGKDAFPGYDKMRALTAKLLQKAAKLAMDFDSEGNLKVTIENLAGHSLPTGATAERQMWLRVVLKDITHKPHAILFASGTLDSRGDLREDIESHTLEPGTDPFLVKYGQRLIFRGLKDHHNPFAHVVEMPWQADWQENHLIPVSQIKSHTYPLSGYLVEGGKYHLEVKLLFRSFPPYFLRILEKEAGLDPKIKDRLPIVEMAGITKVFEW